MKLDLHVHTTASDGQYAPKEMIHMAKEKELSYIAITDHDTVEGIAEARLCAKAEAVNLIAGIEISTMDREEVHMLGFGIDENNKVLQEACESYKRERLGRGEREGYL